MALSLGAYQSQVTRGNVLDAIAHPQVFNPGQAIGQYAQIANSLQQLKANQFNLQQAQLQPVWQQMRVLAATNPDPTEDQFMSALGAAKRNNGNIDSTVANYTDWKVQNPQGKPGDYMRAIATGGMSPENQFQATVGFPQTHDTGNAILTGITGGAASSRPGQFQLGTSIARGLTPGESTDMIQVGVNPDGSPRMAPRGATFGQPYGGAPAGGGQPGGGPAPAPAGPPPGSPAKPGQPLSQMDSDLATFAQRESGNQNIYSRVPVPGYTPQQSGSGYYQIIPSTWAEGQQLAGIPPQQRTQTAIEASPQQQYQVAAALYGKYGGAPWARSAPQGQPGAPAAGSGPTPGPVAAATPAGPGGQPGGPFVGATSAVPVTGGSAVAPQGAGGGANVQPAAAPTFLDPYGRPAGAGGAGGGGQPYTGYTGLPMGAPEVLKADIEARNNASLGAADQRKTLQAGESALEALRLAKGYTGPGTDFTSRASAFLQAQAPELFVPQGGMTDTAWRQVLAKNLLRFAQNSGIRGNTDLGLTEQLKGSANVDQMLPAANEHVLLQDIGLARQRMAQTMLMPPPSMKGDVVNHMRSYTGDTDYRGFSWDLMDQPARDAIEAQVKKSGPAAVARLTKAIHDGIALGLTKPPAQPQQGQ